MVRSLWLAQQSDDMLGHLSGALEERPYLLGDELFAADIQLSSGVNLQQQDSELRATRMSRNG
jgi:hypothetical protein